MGMLRQFVDWLESGEKTPSELLAICLERIARRDDELRAWVEVHPQPSGDGPLRGIPFAAKDTYETRGLATEYGSPLYAGRKGESDAALVTKFRELGAVLVGKTQTTAFAYFDPAPTRNPFDSARTPGGSSSGSAAAVASGMVPFALGSQTQGSVLRPASYCGVTGFKPTFGLLPVDGLLPFAPFLDTVGLFTQTADDMCLLWQRMGFSIAGGGKLRAAVAVFPWDAEPPMQTAFDCAVKKLTAEGFAIERADLPQAWTNLLPAIRVVNHYEGSRTMEQLWRLHGAGIGAKLAQLVEEGLSISAGQYDSALETIQGMKQEMRKVFQEYPVLLTPAAPGAAPLGLAATGDPRMNSPWTALGVPAISIPMQAPGSLPLGLQLSAEAGNDGVLVDFARNVSAMIRRPLCAA